MDDFKPKNLKNVEDLFIITSTQGEGDPPDNAMNCMSSFMVVRHLNLKV